MNKITASNIWVFSWCGNTYNFKRMLNLIGVTLLRKLIIALQEGNIDTIRKEIVAHIAHLWRIWTNIMLESLRILFLGKILVFRNFWRVRECVFAQSLELGNERVFGGTKPRRWYNLSKSKGVDVQRRTFIKYSALTGTTTMFPQLASANKFTDAVTVAWYASKLNPVRLIAGLIFDRIAEVYVEPLLKQAYSSFLDGGSVSKSSLSFYNNKSPEIKVKKEIYVEPYKASIITYSRRERTDYYLNRQKEIQLELIKNFDKERFATIHQYFKENHIKIKQYSKEVISTVGNDLTPADLFNIDYIAYGNTPKQKHIENLLKKTGNSVLGDLVV